MIPTVNASICAIQRNTERRKIFLKSKIHSPSHPPPPVKSIQKAILWAHEVYFETHYGKDLHFYSRLMTEPCWHFRSTFTV